MDVRYIDLLRENQDIELELTTAMERVRSSGHYILSPEVEAFEEEFAACVDARHCVGVGNGVDAIRLILMANGIGRGDDVIVPANTCTPTWLGISACGATPKPVDPCGDTFNIEAHAIEAALDERTRAILVVHLYGQPCDMVTIERLAASKSLLLLQDCAQAHGALSHGKPLGRFANAAAWSFYPTKNLGALGDAGAVTTDDGVMAARIRELRNCGTGVASTHGLIGANSRLDALQAAVLRTKLRHLASRNARRRKLAGVYLEGLTAANLRLPYVPGHATPCWHMFVIRSKARDSIKAYLHSKGIETLVRYARLPYLEAGFERYGFTASDYPVSERIRAEVLSLPVAPHLNIEQVERVVELLNAYAGDHLAGQKA